VQPTHVSQKKKVTAILLRAEIGAFKLLMVKELAHPITLFILLNIHVLVYINVPSRTKLSQFQYLNVKPYQNKFNKFMVLTLTKVL